MEEMKERVMRIREYVEETYRLVDLQACGLE